MIFNSFDFLKFFPIVVLIYFIIPKKIRYIWLLIASMFFYMCWNVKYAILLLVSIGTTWLAGWLLHKFQENKRAKKCCVAGCFVVNIGILACFKYMDFFIDTCNNVLNRFGIQLLDKPFDFLLPVGISFYTFQALGYIIDVYRGEIEPEKNIFKYALFVSFFPQLVAGPIERSKNLLSQVQDVENKINNWFDEELNKYRDITLPMYKEKIVKSLTLRNGGEDRWVELSKPFYHEDGYCG